MKADSIKTVDQAVAYARKLMGWDGVEVKGSFNDFVDSYLVSTTGEGGITILVFRDATVLNIASAFSIADVNRRLERGERTPLKNFPGYKE